MAKKKKFNEKDLSFEEHIKYVENPEAYKANWINKNTVAPKTKSLFEPSKTAKVDNRSDYEKSLDQATKVGQAMEVGKFAVNASLLAKNNATTPPDDIISKRTGLLSYQDINADFTEVNRDLGKSIGQMRAMGLGSSHINSLFRSGIAAKGKMISGVNDANRQGRMGIQSANASIEASNNANQLKTDVLNAERNMKLGAAKADAESKMYGSLFDNATNVYNYQVDNVNKKLKKKQYDDAIFNQKAQNFGGNK